MLTVSALFSEITAESSGTRWMQIDNLRHNAKKIEVTNSRTEIQLSTHFILTLELCR
jgi:hypothetical protein